MKNRYGKHNLYWGVYKPQNDFTVIEEARWIVRKMLANTDEGGVFSNNENENNTEEICLILEDENNNFWPVISFLNKKEVKNLIESLIEFIK